MAAGSKRNCDYYDKPHDIYVLADPRTGEIRYVGRTSKRGQSLNRLIQHLKDTVRGEDRPIHRWLKRLAARGLSPLAVCVAEGVDCRYETLLCEDLVEAGARLLNVCPSYPRERGPLVVDVESTADGWIADIVQLGITFPLREKHFSVRPYGLIAIDPPFKLMASAFRRTADLLDPKEGDTPPHYQQEMAMMMAERFVRYVVEGNSIQSLFDSERQGPQRAFDAISKTRSVWEARQAGPFDHITLTRHPISVGDEQRYRVRGQYESANNNDIEIDLGAQLPGTSLARVLVPPCPDCGGLLKRPRADAIPDLFMPEEHFRLCVGCGSLFALR